MILRRVDPRFCLPRAPRTASIVGGLGGWAAGLEEAGVKIVGPAESADLVVAGADSVAAAVRSGAGMIVVEGRGGAQRLRRLGLRADRFLVRPDPARPDFLLPLQRPHVADYAIRTWSDGSSRSKRARNHLASVLVRGRLLPEVGPVVAVASRTPGSPYVVGAAERLGVPSDADWLLLCGRADALSRNVFLLFEKNAHEPSWALKFARLPGYEDPFLRDEHGLAIAQGSEIAAKHAPTLLGRFQVDGLEASLETAAVGRTLRDALLAPGPDGDKRALIDAVASWLVRLGKATASSPDDLEGERRRLQDDVIPAWRQSEVAATLVRDLPPVPAVLQHNDLGTWNIIAGRRGFTAVDWEAARRFGLPLWDLLYFLTDALATLDRAATPADQDEHTRLLLRGESPRSDILFDWLRRMADELAIPDAAIGPIATLSWLHHGLSPGARTAVSERFGSDTALPAPASRVVDFWLDDPKLGPHWAAWPARS
jgi:hypothetical protein